MISLLTPTRNRAATFLLTQKWILNQRFREKVQWIVVNDGQETYDHIHPEIVTVQRRTTTGEDPGSSLALNLLEGMRWVKGDAVVIIEDDDWYHPLYLQTTVAALKTWDLHGFHPNRHYHMGKRAFRVWDPGKHCNLGSTALRRSMYGPFMRVLQDQANAGKFNVDVAIWREPCRKGRTQNSQWHVGLKGLPGQKGYGIGHKGAGMTPDPDLGMLRLWVGAEAAQDYLDVLNGRTTGPVEAQSSPNV